MGMASNTSDVSRVRADFKAIVSLRKAVLEIAPDLRGFDTVSMGMSYDYPLAIEEGSNLVRVGTTASLAPASETEWRLHLLYMRGIMLKNILSITNLILNLQNITVIILPNGVDYFVTKLAKIIN